MRNLLIAAIAGVLLPFALAPHDIYPLAVFCPAALLYCWLQAKPAEAFWQGLVFGLTFFTVGSGWLYISIHHFGNATPFLAGLITFLFILLMACYPATQGLILRLLFRQKPAWVISLCAFPATWVLWEWIRSFLFDGFSFLFLGYAQLATPLRGIAPLLGTYGLSLCTVAISGAVVVLLTKNTARLKVVSVAIILVIAILGFATEDIRWTTPVGKPLTVSLIQGNIPQSMKWDAAAMRHIIDKYRQLTDAHWQSNLIVWPEASVPFFPNALPDFFETLNQVAKQHDTYLLFGAPLKNLKTQQYYNGLLLIGAGKGRYLKRRLVPYGEFIPLKNSLGRLMQYFNIPMADTTPGPAIQAPVFIRNTPVATFICYETAFPISALNATRNTGLVINISDDAWFGRSWALYQQLQMTQMRALETGRYAITATNTGVTAIIDPLGNIVKQLPIDQTNVLTGPVWMMKGNTPLLRWSYYPVLALLLLCLLIAFSTPKSSTAKRT